MFEETYKLKQYGYIDEDMIPIKTINGAKFLFDNMFVVYRLNKDNTHQRIQSVDEIVDGYMYGIKDEEFYDIQMTCEVFNNEV